MATPQRMSYLELLNIRGRRHRRTLAQQIVTDARTLQHISQIEIIISKDIGPRGNSSHDRVRSTVSHYYEPPNPDPARSLHDLAILDRHLNTASQAMRNVAIIIERIRHQPTPADFDLKDDQPRPADACEWHWTAFRIYEPAHTANPTTVAGTLPTPATICAPCYERVRQLGHQPRRPDLEHHRDHGKWPKRAITTRRRRR